MTFARMRRQTAQSAVIVPNVEPGPDPRRAVKSAERTVALLELFSLYGRPLRIGAICRELRLPRSSANELVSTLMRLGYLDYDPTAHAYLPNLRVAMLGAWLYDFHGINLDVELDHLVRRYGVTAILAIRNGVHTQYVRIQWPETPGELEVQSGQLRPITATSVGRAILSTLPPAEIGPIVRRCNAEFPDFSVSVGDFMQAYQRIRQDGFARSLTESPPGWRALAVGARVPDRSLTLGIGVLGREALIQANEPALLAELLRIRTALDQNDDPMETHR